MKYLKPYKIFESREEKFPVSNDFLSKLENHYQNVDYDLLVNKNARNMIAWRMNLIFTYTDCEQYELICRETHDYDLGRKKWVYDLYLGKGLLYQDVQDLYLNIFRIQENTIRLVSRIRSYIFPNYTNTFKTNSEIRERMVEFDILRDGKLDTISLNRLFDFYELKFDEKEFLFLLERDKKFLGHD